MRLITIPLLIILIFCLFAIFIPVLLLEASETIVPADIRNNGAQVMADVSAFLGRYDTTIGVYDYLIRKNPESAPYYGKKAQYLQISGNLQDTLSALDGAIARDPENPEYLLKKARILRLMGKIAESDAIYTKIDAIIPRDSYESVLCGNAALDRSKYLQAYTLFTRAVSENPSDDSTWEKRGDVIFALLTIYTGSMKADESFKNKDLYSEGIQSYENAVRLNASKTYEVEKKIEKRSDSYTPKTIAELESRYTEYKYTN